MGQQHSLSLFPFLTPWIGQNSIQVRSRTSASWGTCLMIFWSQAGSKRPIPPSILFASFIVVCLFDRSLTCAQLQGVVLNSETGQPLAKVELVLTADSPATEEYRVTSDGDGSFQIDEVDPGLYQMISR